MSDYVSYISAICSDPGYIDYGRATYTALYHQGASVTYHCDDGYSMTGDNTLTCQSNGTWDKLSPTCNRQGKVNYYYKNNNKYSCYYCRSDVMVVHIHRNKGYLLACIMIATN